jgi:tape measure domain-containing protein
MPSIDERVVAMSFENAKFEAGVAQTMATLQKLNDTIAKTGSVSGLSNIEKDAAKVTLQAPMSALDKLKAKLSTAGNTQGFTDIEKASTKVSLLSPLTALDKLKARLGTVADTKGFNDITTAADRVDLSSIGKGLDNLQSHFSAMEATAVVALGNVASKALLAGGQLAKMFTSNPITEGFHNYETQINAVQTILANTGLHGKKGLDKVTAALNNLNTYANQTVYNFSEMAKNIGTFTAAGVDLNTATGAIKGIANLAAMSGSSSAQASQGMYQLSQAIAAGRVNLQDWNSVVNAGFGGKVFQKALVDTAQAMGTLKDGSVKMVGPMKQLTVNGESFRNSISARGGGPSWLTSDVLTKALEHFTGDMTDAQLAAQGFSKAQIKAIQSQAKVAVGAATKIKTFSQLMQALKEEVASSWAQVWKTLFGDINQAKSLFSPLHIAVENFLRGPIDSFNKQLKVWAKLGGRTMLFTALENGFKALGAVLGSIKKAFRDIFPAQTGKNLLEMTKRFRDFTANLKASPQTLENLRKTFRGFFAVLGIGWYIVKKVFGVIGDLLGLAKSGSGGFLSFTGGIGDFLTSLHKVIVKGDALGGFFKALGNIIRVPFELIKGIAGALGGLFSGVDTKKAGEVGKTVGDLSNKLGPLENVLKKIGKVGKKIMDTMNKIFEPFSKTISGIGHAIVGLGQGIGDAFAHANFDKIFGIVQTALVGGIFLAIKKALNQPINLLGGVTGTLKNISGVLGGLTSNLKEMQSTIKAATLLAIATAILALAAGVTILSSIDPKKLSSAMTAVAVGLGELIGALALLDKSTKGGSFATLPLIAASMIGLALAVTILAAAVKIFSTMSTDQLIKGLVGVAGSLAAVGVAMKLIGPSISLSAPGILAVALAMNVLAVAMKIFGSMKWSEITKGLIGVGGSLLAMGLGMQAFGPSILLIGPGLIIASTGLLLLAGAVGAFGSMDLASLAKGVLGIGAAIVVLGISMAAIPPTIALQAAGLLVAGVALLGLAGAVKAFGSMDVITIVKGIVTMAAALLVMAVGLTAMTATLPGSVALLAAAAAFAVLAPVIAVLGALSWGALLKGLVAMAAALVVLGVVGGAVSAGLIALGVGLTAVGVGVTVIGAGIYLIAKALVMLGDASIKSTGIAIAAITAFIVAVPKMVIDFIKGLVSIQVEILKLAPGIVEGLAKIIGLLADALVKLAPKFVQVASALLHAFTDVLNQNNRSLIDAGLNLLVNLLKGISSHIGKITTNVANIVIHFLDALRAKLPDLIAAGAKFLQALLQGVSQHVGKIAGTAVGIIVKLDKALLNGAWRLVRAGINFVIKVLDGIAKKIPDIRKSAIHLIRVFLHNVAKALVDLAGIAFDALTGFFEALATKIDKKAPKLRKAMRHLAWSMMDAFSFGIAGKAKDAGDSILNAVKAPTKKLPVKQGTVKGDIPDNFGRKGPRKKTAAAPNADAAVSGIRNSVKKTNAALAEIEDVQPVITPVLDLTEVEKGAKRLTDVTSKKPILANVSFKHAAAISDAEAASRKATANQAEQARVELKFEQNNTSPEALSEREIYRRTRNQLAQARHALQGVGGFAQVIT